MRKGCIHLVVSLLIIMTGLFVEVIGDSFYTQQVQAKECYAYAQHKALPNLEYLEFSSATLATGQFHGHICQFTDKRNGFPVTLKFEAQDVPYGSDTMNVFWKVGLFLAGAGLAMWATDRVGLSTNFDY